MLIYELYIDKFAKNVNGLINKLDYLKSLSIDYIWLLPHYPSQMVDDGYDVSDYKNIRSDLGTLDDFKLLVAKAHALDIKILIDLPINHTSTEHAWFKEARSSLDNPKRDYYLWSKSGADMLSAVNAFPNVKLTNWIYNPFTKDYYFATFYPLQPDLNWDNPKVLEEFFDIIDFWFDLGIDGVRLDALTHLIKRKHSVSIALPETHNIVAAIRKHIDSKYNSKVLIGEVDLPTTHALEYFGKEDNECTTLFDFEGSLYTWLYYFEQDESIINIIKNNSQGIKKYNSWIYFLGTHDTLSLNVMNPDIQAKLKKWIDPQNEYDAKHDKRVARRVADILNSNVEAIIKAYKTLLSIKGHHVIYYGDELGMKSKASDEFLIDNRHAIRGDFDWTEADRQDKDKYSLLNKLRELFVAQSI